MVHKDLEEFMVTHPEWSRTRPRVSLIRIAWKDVPQAAALLQIPS